MESIPDLDRLRAAEAVAESLLALEEAIRRDPNDYRTEYAAHRQAVEVYKANRGRG